MAGSKKTSGGKPRPVRSGRRSDADRAEARRRLAEREREEGRRRRQRRGLIAVGAVLAVVLLVVLEVFLHRPSGEEKALLARAPAAAASAGCGDVRRVGPYSRGLDR